MSAAAIPGSVLLQRVMFQMKMLERRRARLSRTFWREAIPSLTHMIRFSAFLCTTRLPPRRAANDELDWVAVVLSYRRPLNIEPIVRAILRCRGCATVVVSNNDPDVDIRRWLRVRDPRLHIIDQAERTFAGIRLELARRTPAARYVLVDDDMFLSSAQVAALVAYVRADPDVPHGVFGEVRDDRRSPYPYRSDCGGDREVDHLTNVYAFTRSQLETCFEILGSLGMDATLLANGEDLCLSAAGSAKPKTHDLGRVLRCASTADIDIATCKSRPGFFEERLALLERLHRAGARSGPSTQI